MKILIWLFTKEVSYNFINKKRINAKVFLNECVNSKFYT